MELKLDWDSSDLGIFRSAKLERAMIKALKRAGDTALRDMKSASSKAVRKRKRMKVSRVNRGLPTILPKGRRISDLVWTMKVSGEPVPVSVFSIRQTRKGVKVAINQGQSKIIKGAFIAQMNSGHIGVFRRRGKDRLPIDETFTTRISDVFYDRNTIPEIQGVAERSFSSGFKRLLDLELSRLGK